MTDEELVKDFKRGDREAFSELVRRHSKPLTMTILRMVRDPEEAKDISQTAFLKAYEKLSGFMMASSFKTWLYRIAVNAAKDHLRTRKSRIYTELLEDLPQSGKSHSERLEQWDLQARVREVVQELPDKQRMTLQLRIYEEMDYKEISRILGGTEGAARVNFFQAVKVLREKLGRIL